MSDWFEIRFREVGEPEGLDPAFAARVRTLVVDAWGEDAVASIPRETEVGGTDAGTDHDLEEVIMLETEERVRSDEPGEPPRSRRGRWVVAAAAVVAIAVMTALLVGDTEDDVDTATADPAPPAREVPQVEEFLDLEPGRWFVDVDGDPATTLRVSFDIVEEGWMSWLGAANFSGASHVVLTTMTVDNVVADACTDHTPADPPVGPSVDDLATALTQLRPFEVSSPPRDVTLLGYEGTHLQLTVPDLPTTSDRGNVQFAGCTGGNLESWYSPLHDGGERAYFGYNGESGRTEDFWILDVDGTRLVITTQFGPGSMDSDVAELEAIFDSIRIEP